VSSWLGIQAQLSQCGFWVLSFSQFQFFSQVRPRPCAGRLHGPTFRTTFRLRFKRRHADRSHEPAAFQRRGVRPPLRGDAIFLVRFGPRLAANREGISERTLRRRFERCGLRLAVYTKERRLKLVQRLLATDLSSRPSPTGSVSPRRRRSPASCAASSTRPPRRHGAASGPVPSSVCPRRQRHLAFSTLVFSNA